MNKDIFGEAIKDFYNQKYTEDIIVQAPDFDDDIIPIPYLFRSYNEMPELEKKALDLSYGKVLDVGSGAGSHSLYLQNTRDIDVTAIDISAGAIDICKKRGLQKAIIQDIFELKNTTYDTLLFLMNGSGIIGNLSNIDRFFSHIKTLLAPKGQILIDSSDISYLFTDNDGGFWVDASAGYYGEMQYKLKYKNLESDWFDWLYIDYNTLQNAANTHGFLCELLSEGENNDYLVKCTIIN
ncbi:class I SAM-dependent methyltransferase [Aquimarina sp. AD10]|uniref:Methyltransferase n=1 Tax=Aquimarina aggregata TaxID=1642818 RepID=A0A163BB16_9FLAO|nr:MULTISPECIES: class I SAM-dependent methyltransferase [Aquimarina]AXT60715.1 class I SAM-dependent methyltransferase [Aquimarina sp. AD10]KZS41205.1 methyltransferase [Aquimarina aggregata]RKM95742.1 class I SAM-dependent methyltransferase [Aquimarina sp. AD10]